MEDLTKQQLIMAALLVSFVTSIATGIVTVSLVNQNPQGGVQTINRVIEKTVERIVPVANQASVFTKETLVVSQDNMASEAVAKNTNSLVRIFGVPISNGVVLEEAPKFLGIGIVINAEGIIVGDKGILSGGTHYIGTLYDGTKIILQVIAADNENDITLFRATKQNGETKTPKYIPATLGNSDDLKLGQTIISLYGEERNRVSLGIVSSLIEKVARESSNDLETYAIETDLHSDDITLGSFLLNLEGNVIGIKTSTLAGDRDTYLAINVISAKVPILLNPPKTQ